MSCHNSICHTQQEKERIVQNANNLHNLCTHIEVIKEKLFLEDIPETKGSYELADQFQEDECLTLSTIHQAKGLEWDAVFVIGLTEGQFPHQRSLEPESLLEEERRLFYVAITRARRFLTLTAPIVSSTFSGSDFADRSRFIEEFPQELVSFVTSHKEKGELYSRHHSRLIF